jgi:MFS transporter, DHA1 family, tetracycline resistance protein
VLLTGAILTAWAANRMRTWGRPVVADSPPVV